ncbi:MAG TPA: hypothetical protein VGK19_09740 [Capsulimonadaceae bacterium]
MQYKAMKYPLVLSLLTAALCLAGAVALAESQLADVADDYTYRFPESVAIQFIGVSPSVAASQTFPAARTWWMPNGQKAAIAISTVSDLKACKGGGSGNIYREFVMSVTDSRKLPIPITAEVIVPAEVAGAELLSDIVKRGAIRHTGTIPANVEACDVYLGVAAGQWTTIAKCAGVTGASSTTSDGKSVLFAPAYQITGGVMVPISDSLAKSVLIADGVKGDADDFRIVAVDTKGNIVPADKMQSGAATGEFRLTTAVFPTLKLSDIKELRAQTRPFRWVEFPQVALNMKQPELPASVLAATPALRR